MVNPNIRKPTSPPPPVPKGVRRTGINVDADGRRTRLPGDTVRQNITPGRIRNLASMFDKKAQIHEMDEQPIRKHPLLLIDNMDEFRTPSQEPKITVNEFHTPRQQQDEATETMNLNGFHTPRQLQDEATETIDLNEFYTPQQHQEYSDEVELLPPRKPLRSFANESFYNTPMQEQDENNNEPELIPPRKGSFADGYFDNRGNGFFNGGNKHASGDFLPKTRKLSSYKEHNEHGEESHNYGQRVEIPLENYVVEVPLERHEEKARKDSRGEEAFLEEDILDEEITDAYSPRDSLFVSCVGEQSPTALKVSMLMDDEMRTIIKKGDDAKKRRNHTMVIKGVELDPVLPVEHCPRSRTTSRGDEQSVNGHIDNLFDFVDEHLSTKHSRSSRECLYQPRYSPTAAPNIAEMSQDCSVSVHGKTNKSNNSKSSKRVGSALATSTPQNSPRSTSTNHNRSRLGEDELSFVSTIQDASQVEAITHYELMISKNEHALDRNNQQIAMLAKALTHARKERKPMQEVNAQKSLLVAKERVVLLQREIKRLKALVACRRPIPNQCLEVRGSLTISNIAVHLNRNFYTRPYEINSNYSFLVILKCGCEVECTATHNLLAHQSTRLKVVHFDEKINFCNLPVDFCVMLEVYAMAIPEKEPETTCASIIAKRPPSTSPSGFPYGEFVRCGYLQLTRDTTGTNKFYLDDVEYPLDGTVELTTHCTTLPPAIAIDYRGFLTMYQCISGMSSWERYWAVLRRGIIFFWKYPEDESMEKPPKARLDLSTCPQYEIHPCSVEQCPRAFTFTVNVLVNTAPSVMDKKRIFLSADSRSLMKDWLDAINETLAVIRGHHPYKGSILPRN